MKWVKRALWVATWGVWVWCGIGLARELPRDLGPPLRRQELGPRERIIRFVPDTIFAVTRCVAPDGVRSCRLWDLATVSLTRQPIDAYLDSSDREYLAGQGPESEREERMESLEVFLKTIMSSDGRTKLDISEQTVNEISTGRRIDKGTEQPWSIQQLHGLGPFGLTLERFLTAPDGARFYFAYETWRVALGSASMVKKTSAVHVMADGRLLFRVKYTPNWITADGGLCLDAQENIYALPPPLNYPLLALCQTILALPLILLWSILRWRRNRQLRLESVQP